MTVAELAKILKSMPQNAIIEVNDNAGGQIHFIDRVEFFDADTIENGNEDYPVVMIQVNTED